MEATEIGRRLAERHAATAEARERPEVDPVRSLLNYAEAPHTGDWTLRSALVRLAQRDPARVGALLQVMRRLDAPLHHVSKILSANPVVSDDALAGHDGPMAEAIGGEPGRPYPDIRTADLARVAAAGLDDAALLAGYREVTPLDREVELAVPLLAVAARFDAAARELAIWADGGPVDPPLDTVDRLTVEARQRLDELGVPEETRPPRGGRSRG